MSPWSSVSEARPGAGARAEPSGVPGGRARHARGPAAARGPLRGDARAAADRAVRRRAVSADVTVDGNDVSTGRIILLHDPAGNDAWDGTFRCVAYARAEIDLEMITDPLLADVGWSWLTEALDGARRGVRRGLGHGHPGRHRELRRRWPTTRGTAQIEIRASWTPLPAWSTGTLDIGPHVEAWGELLCTAAGLPPVPEGVTAMPSRRGQRGAGH